MCVNTAEIQCVHEYKEKEMKSRKIFSIILALIMIVSMFPLTTPVSAASTMSDVNGDGTVNAIDSNVLRRIIAGTYSN